MMKATAFQRRPAEALPALWMQLEGLGKPGLGPGEPQQRAEFLAGGRSKKQMMRQAANGNWNEGLHKPPTPARFNHWALTLPIFPDMHRLPNEDGCWCNEYQHMWGLAKARVGVWKSLQMWGDSPLGWGPWWGPGVGWSAPQAAISLPLLYPAQGCSQHTSALGSHPHPKVLPGSTVLSPGM